MTSTSTLAQTLADAFRTGACVVPSPDELPAGLEAAERIQDAMIAAMGPIAAWKLGAAARAGQVQMGLPRMFLGALPSYRVFQSGDDVSGLWTDTVGVEVEYAYRFGRDLPAGSGPQTAESVAEALSGVHAAFEIPASRFAGIGVHGGFAQVADDGASGWMVVGGACTVADWNELLTAQVDLKIADETRSSGTAKDLEGTPLQIIADFVGMAHARGHDIRAGQFVVTGSCTGYVQVPLNTSIRGVFALGGQVEARFRHAASGGAGKER